MHWPWLLAPLLPGIINRVKAVFAGRHGKPLLQTYYDLAKLLGKGEARSRTTTWIFAAAPAIGLAGALCALALLPLGGAVSPLAFTGDVLLAAYLLGMGRFALMLAALDTGSAFEGMGASPRSHLFRFSGTRSCFWPSWPYQPLSGPGPGYGHGLYPLRHVRRADHQRVAPGQRSPAPVARHLFHPAAGGELPHPGGRPQHPSGTDHDP